MMYNYVLESMDFSSLVTIYGNYTVQENTSLPQCDACAVLDQLTTFTGSVYVNGNEADTCADDCP